MAVVRNAISGLALGLLLSSTAAGDPVGSYRVVIGGAGDGPKREGQVSVTRSEEAYRVVWSLGGETATGIALGGAFNRGDLVIGPAHVDDLMLVIGYLNGAEYGSATMILQVDGSYQGYRVSNRTGKAVPERWTPLR